MFDQVLTKGRVQAGKITSDDTPEGILTCVLMESGNILVIGSSGRLVMTNLNFFKWST